MSEQDPGARPSLAEQLQTSYRRQFVGRQAETTLFQEALSAAQPPFVLLHLYGPGGVGKTTLLHEFNFLCRQADVLCLYLDGEEIEPTPRSFLMALRRELDLAEEGDPAAYLAAQTRRHVLLIDSYDELTRLQNWLRDRFLPGLSRELLVVLAGRQPLNSRWRLDPGWQPLIRTISLRNLPPDSSRLYLAQQGIPTEQHGAILSFTHGQPLALALIADTYEQRPFSAFIPQDNPDVIRALLKRFVAELPGPAHRVALDVCCLVRLTTEALLAAVMQMDDVHDLFAWLRSLSFIDARSEGLAPHALARESLAADLQWRNPDWYHELNGRIRSYYKERVAETQGVDQQNVLIDYIYLHRDNPVIRPFFQQFQEQAAGDFVAYGRPSADELPLLRAMVARHEGPTSAQIAAHWFAQQPHNVTVFRDQDEQPVGFMSFIALHEADAASLAADPATAAAWTYLQEHAALRPSEGALHFRFWLDDAGYQGFSAVQAFVFVRAVRHYLTTPNLAFSFFACANAEFWAPLFAYADLALLPQAGFTVDERPYGVFAHDWRAVPPTRWLDILAGRESLTTPVPSAPPPEEPPLLVLSRDSFSAAVRDALRAYTQPEALIGNPLLQSRLVIDQTGIAAAPEARAAALRAFIEQAADSLQQSPRDRKYYRALYHTYLQPAPTQQAAAELLDLPYGSFRRHLKRAVSRVDEALWQREIG